MSLRGFLVSSLIVGFVTFAVTWPFIGNPMEAGLTDLAWPPAGIGMALLALFGLHAVAGLYVALVLLNASIGLDPTLNAVLCLSGSIGAVLGAALLRGRGGRPPTFRHRRDFLAFFVFGVFLASAVGAACEQGIYRAFGYMTSVPFGMIWEASFLIDAAGVLIFAPVILAFGTRRPWTAFRDRPAEAVSVLGLLTIATWFVWFDPSGLATEHGALVFVPLPAILWLAFRFDARGGTLASTVFSMIALSSTALGLSPMFVENHHNSALVLLIVLMLTIASTLIVATLLTERERVNAVLARRSERLRRTVEIMRRTQMQNDRLGERIRDVQKVESLGALAGGVAHDFNNLLTAIVGHADLALDTGPGEPTVHQHLEDILAVSEDARGLCMQMLAYSGRGRFHVRPIDLGHEIRETTRLLDVCREKAARLVIEAPTNLPWIEADGVQIRQVILNVVNASEALDGRPGTIRISLSKTDLDESNLDEAHCANNAQPGPYLSMTVSDDGRGMDAETRAKVFDPFFSTKATGRGLGLATVLGIVRGHRGCVFVETEPGRGTAFRILLPAIPRPAPPETAEDATPVAADFGARSPRILVVDDEESVRAFLVSLLQRRGATVVARPDGESALEWIEDRIDEIDVVLTDLTMPGIDGLELLARIHARRPALPVVLISGYDAHELSNSHAEHGFSGFVQKPFRSSELMKQILRSLPAAEPGRKEST